MRRRVTRRILLTFLFVVAALAFSASAASAHVVPGSTLRLDRGDAGVEAVVSIPVSDVESATGLDLGDGSQAAVTAQRSAVTSYLLAHFVPTSDDGTAWTVTPAGFTVTTAGDSSTGTYQALTATFELTPAAGESLTEFNLGYDAIVDKVATHTVIVTAVSGEQGDARREVTSVGVVKRDTVTGDIGTVHVDLASGGGYRGFAGMVALGMEHIAEGTDHQLFLLTILLPTPLLALRRRWSAAVPARTAIRRIGSVTLAFTAGHSITLALGALGVPVPAAPIEALIAVSILVAAAHAVRPLFAGREALVAGGFGLIHGLAFSETLRDLNLSGYRLVTSLLGFNVGIELMQLVVVALVLPPLVLLARSGRYRGIRLMAAALTGVAAVGWLADRVGLPNVIATAADQLGAVALPLVAVLWLAGFGPACVSPRSIARAERGKPATE
ncbi:HupE/UreJ family protein [Actinoplanes sp. URMC 104]|uniref:HupE/UreJ family protein n=1 Tax=Actinoplanes sp. URMC 104 TaxID=3423409 RepID=UPI003F1B7672